MSWRAQLSRHVQELRFMGCSTSESSGALRKFHECKFYSLEMLNPALPMLYREADGIAPEIYARFDWGVDKMYSLEGLDVKGIEGVVEQIVLDGKNAPKSSESDILLYPQVILSGQDETMLPCENKTWDGVTVRQRPDLQGGDQLTDRQKKMLEEVEDCL